MAYSSSTYTSMRYAPSKDARYQQIDRPGTVPPPKSSYGHYSQPSGPTEVYYLPSQEYHGKTTYTPVTDNIYSSKITHPSPQAKCPDNSRLENQTHYNSSSSSNGHSSNGSQATATQSSSGVSYPSSPLRPYTCDQCTLAFNRAHDLKRHRETHTNSKPYQCPGCAKTFTRKDAVKRHQVEKRCGVGLEIRQAT